jgi:CRP/FNR family transcriptional regulator, cyclic AMP receptor protein
LNSCRRGGLYCPAAFAYCARKIQCLMSHPFQQINLLKENLPDPEWCKKLFPYTLRIPKHNNVYVSGDEDQMIYFIVSGQVKIVIDSVEGKECLLCIYSVGDLFGESCLAGLGARIETVIAMEYTILKKIPCEVFLSALSGTQLRVFLQYILRRIVEQQVFIADLTTLDSEHRLGKALLQLSRKLGKPHSAGTVIKCKISQEELSQIVGTTRPRISTFINKFRELGLMSISAERYIIVREKRLAEYLDKSFGHSAPASTHLQRYF